MKKTVFTRLLSAFVLMGAIFFNSCASNPKANSTELCEPLKIDGVESKSGNFIITNLPHFELMAIVCRMAGLPEFNGYYTDDNSYLEQMTTLFDRFKNHAIVSTAKGFVTRGVTGEAFVSLAYHIKSDFSGPVVPFSPKPDTLHNNWSSIPVSEIYGFIKLLHDFAIESNFERIYGLNKSTTLGECLHIQNDLEKYKYDEWMQEFFNAPGEEKPIYLNSSRANAGFGFYDHAVDENNNLTFHVTSYPGNIFNSYASCYALCYVQLYVSENWETVKDNFTKFIKAITLRTVGDDKEKIKAIEKMEIQPAMLGSFLTEIIVAYYSDEVFAEIDEIYGILDENINTGIKIYGEEVTYMIFDLFQDYIDNRDTYPNFKAFYPKITETILNLPSEIQ